MDSVITSNTYVFNLQKSNFYFKVVLSNIPNPDETKEKKEGMCDWAAGVGKRGTCPRARATLDASPSRSAGGLHEGG